MSSGSRLLPDGVTALQLQGPVPHPHEGLIPDWSKPGETSLCKPKFTRSEQESAMGNAHWC